MASAYQFVAATANRQCYVRDPWTDQWRRESPQRWRTHKSVRAALYVARRNKKAGKLVWIERVGQPATKEQN